MKIKNVALKFYKNKNNIQISSHITSAIGHFLLVGNWYQACISNCFRDICI